jgi:hypothetical protein
MLMVETASQEKLIETLFNKYKDERSASSERGAIKKVQRGFSILGIRIRGTSSYIHTGPGDYGPFVSGKEALDVAQNADKFPDRPNISEYIPYARYHGTRAAINHPMTLDEAISFAEGDRPDQEVLSDLTRLSEMLAQYGSLGTALAAHTIRGEINEQFRKTKRSELTSERLATIVARTTILSNHALAVHKYQSKLDQKEYAEPVAIAAPAPDAVASEVS